MTLITRSLGKIDYFSAPAEGCADDRIYYGIHRSQLNSTSLGRTECSCSATFSCVPDHEICESICSLNLFPPLSMTLTSNGTMSDSNRTSGWTRYLSAVMFEFSLLTARCAVRLPCHLSFSLSSTLKSSQFSQMDQPFTPSRSGILV
jgi:hypothetical protein